MSYWTQMYLQDSISPSMLMLSSFHNFFVIIMTLLITLISYMMMFLMLNTNTNYKLQEKQNIELVWTTISSLILMSLAIPSLLLLYVMDELHEPALTIKAIGHQWYWSYEYNDFPSISYDSLMIQRKNVKEGEFRVLEVDNGMIVPMNTNIRLLVTSSDVIHAWTIPSLGVKMDVIPGRFNPLNFNLNRAGVFYGQCSEMCGANHSFMRIVIESINTKSFINWSKSTK